MSSVAHLPEPSEGERPLRASGAILLTGGASRRMGRPKAALPYRGRSFLDHVLRAFCEVVEPCHVVVVTAANAEPPPVPDGVRVTADRVPGRGPLEGLAAGWLALPGRVDRVFLASCDAPQLQPAFIRSLLERFTTDVEAVVPAPSGCPQVVPGAYAATIQPALLALLEAGHTRPTELFARVATRFLTDMDLHSLDPHGHNLRNINTPADYARLLAEAGE